MVEAFLEVFTQIRKNENNTILENQDQESDTRKNTHQIGTPTSQVNLENKIRTLFFRKSLTSLSDSQQSSAGPAGRSQNSKKMRNNFNDQTRKKIKEQPHNQSGDQQERG